MGGYQVVDQWLKERKGRILSYDEKVYYMKLLSIIEFSLDLIAEIDSKINSYGGWPIV